MPDYFFKIVLGTHLTPNERNAAAAMLSRAYTRWQTNPRNLAPVETDTSPQVYARMMHQQNREVILYYEGEQLCGVYVHALLPQYDQYPLRKLSYLAIFPIEPGFESLQTAIARYAAFVHEQGEDVIIASDLDQTTLNTLLEHAGFQPVEDRNEIYFLLSRLLQRQVLGAQRVKGDFAIDDIITLDGKKIRRSKKLYKLQTTSFDSYALYYQQQAKRVQRCMPPANLARLQASLQSPEQGIYFISNFDGTITLEDATKGGFDTSAAVIGKHPERVLPGIIDPPNNLVYYLPGSEDELRAIASKIVFRPGFFDFLCFCLKCLGSFFVVSSMPPSLVRFALERPLAPTISLQYIHLVEKVLTPDVQLLPDQYRPAADGTLRAAYRCRGDYIDLSEGRYNVRKERMIDTILSYKGDTPTPVIYLGNDLNDAPPVARLFTESRQRHLPVVVFDFGRQLTDWALQELVDRATEPNRCFNIIGVQDFYQIPVMLEGMGLKIGYGIELEI